MSATNQRPRSVYLYSDETGQQSGGRWLVVVAVSITADRKAIERRLREIEVASEKQQEDWHSCSPKRLRRYLQGALRVEGLPAAVHYRVYENIEPSDYQRYGIDTVLDVADLHRPLANAVFVPEGFTRHTRERLQRAARKRLGHSEVWSSGFKGCSIVRLADALAGLVAQNKFAAGGRKDFPDLVHPSFVHLKNETPRTQLECAGGQA